jgi:hypothetical protein
MVQLLKLYAIDWRKVVSRSDRVGQILCQHRQHPPSDWTLIPSFSGEVPHLVGPASLTVLTVLTALLDCFGLEALILMIRVPLLPSRVNAISMPSIRSDVWARRSRPASARGDFGQAEFPAKRPAAGELAPARWSSDALPVHVGHLAIISRTWAATGSASITPSMAALRFSS